MKNGQSADDWLPVSRMINFETRFWPTVMIVVSFRLIIAFTMNHKVFHPDEIWQGFEMAYQIAYSDKVPIVKTWEWESIYSLRSILYPFYLSIPLHFLRLFGLDSNFAVVASITTMNSLLLALGDIFLYKLSKKFIGTTGAKMTLIYFLFNRRINEVFNKTLTNGAEGILDIIALYFFT